MIGKFIGFLYFFALCWVIGGFITVPIFHATFVHPIVDESLSERVEIAKWSSSFGAALVLFMLATIHMKLNRIKEVSDYDKKDVKSPIPERDVSQTNPLGLNEP